MKPRLSRTGQLVVLLILIACVNNSFANKPTITFDDFDETILDYFPPLVPGVSEDNHALWIGRLEETYARARRNGSFDVPDYWNMMMAFRSMNTDIELASLAFRRAAEVDPEGWLTYLTEMPHDLEKFLPEQYTMFMDTNSGPEHAVATVKKCSIAGEQNLDSILVALMKSIHERDQRHRKEDGFSKNPTLVAAQNRLDDLNAAQIDSLYRSHECYIGVAMVGKQHSTAMWEVVQHSNVEMMERYLPIIQDGAARGDLGTTPLKMLLDRIYHARTGKQIFGSQIGVHLADEETIAQVKQKYGF